MISNLVKTVSFRPLEVSIALEERVEGADESGLTRSKSNCFAALPFRSSSATS